MAVLCDLANLQAIVISTCLTLKSTLQTQETITVDVYGPNQQPPSDAENPWMHVMAVEFFGARKGHGPSEPDSVGMSITINLDCPDSYVRSTSGASNTRTALWRIGSHMRGAFYGKRLVSVSHVVHTFEASFTPDSPAIPGVHTGVLTVEATGSRQSGTSIA